MIKDDHSIKEGALQKRFTVFIGQAKALHVMHLLRQRDGLRQEAGGFAGLLLVVSGNGVSYGSR